MATAAITNVCRAPIPSNYFCKSCGLSAHHWIMDCSLLAVFHAARKMLYKTGDTIQITDALVSISCGDHSITECQSLYRIIMALKFYQNNSFSNNALLHYFNRYNHLLNDYTHILSAHLDQDKEHNDINAALLHTKVHQFIKCQIKTCPSFIRQHHHSHNNQDINENITFYKNTLDTIHCYFLHPFHTGFKMVKSKSFEERHKTHADGDESELISWEDTELMHLQSELNIRRDLLRSIRGNEHNQYSKFMIDIPAQNFAVCDNLCDYDEKSGAERQRAPPMHSYFGERYYYWDWYKNNEREDWRCNPGRKYSDLYISQKYDNLKHEITANNTFRLNIIDFKVAYFKAIKYLSASQVIRTMQSFGNELCHYGINDGQSLKIHHLVSLILHCDYKPLSHKFVQTFRRKQAMVGLESFESDSNFKSRKREFCFWSRYLRETVELYGTPITRSKISIFYVTISNPIIFNSFSARFCLPTSTTSQLEIVSMCTNNNGLILELKSTAEIASFYQGLLKYFNCALISSFAEEDERLFIGGWAPLQINNIRVLIERKENYMIFIRAMQHFNAILDGEESEESDTLDSLYLKLNNTSFTSRLSRNDTSYSEYSQISQTEIKSRNNMNIEMKNEHKCNRNDAEIIHKLCEKNNGYPLYINKMFAGILRERGNIFINLNELLSNYKPFFIDIFVCDTCESLIRFDFFSQLFVNCKVISVDMYNYQQLNTKYLLAFCEEMSKIEKNKNNKLEKIVLLKVKKERITLDIWDKIHRKYSKFKEKLWFKCLCTFRYNFDKDLQVFFDHNAYKLYLKNQQETDDVSGSVSQSEQQNDGDDIWLIDAPKSHRL